MLSPVPCRQLWHWQHCMEPTVITIHLITYIAQVQMYLPNTARDTLIAPVLLIYHPDLTTRNTLNIFPVSMWMMGNFIFRLNKHHTQNNRHWCVFWALQRHPSQPAGNTSAKRRARDKLWFLFILISPVERAGASLLARILSANQSWFWFLRPVVP